MAKFNFNLTQRYKQYKTTAWVIISVVMVLATIVSIFADGTSGSKVNQKKKDASFSGILDDTFSDSDTQSAMTSQQLEVDSLKKELIALKATVEKGQLNQVAKLDADKKREALISKKLKQDLDKVLAKTAINSNDLGLAMKQGLNWPKPTVTQLPIVKPEPSHRLNKPARIHTVSFNYDIAKPVGYAYKKTIENYVPSGTFVKAIVLGGADADASVNGSRKNNGVMLFKLVNQGTLPNNKQSHLQGCFVTASTYGDISSERAYVALDKISCAQKGRPLIDKSVTGWAFFNGKVGIKGKPMMRDGKIVAWAGVSGALSGIASAAQYAQSVQSIGPYGATSIVPGNKIGAYAGLGGASKAADQLSSYYIKRAEQYHPVIQVGAGNLVNIVFKDGFSLLPNAKDRQYVEGNRHTAPKITNAQDVGINAKLVEQINADKTYSLGSQISTQG